MSEQPIKSFRDLKIWQLGVEISEMIYKLTKQLPEDEKYALISQMKRAAISIPANISEGHRRRSNYEV